MLRVICRLARLAVPRLDVGTWNWEGRWSSVRTPMWKSSAKLDAGRMAGRNYDVVPASRLYAASASCLLSQTWSSPLSSQLFTRCYSAPGLVIIIIAIELLLLVYGIKS